MFCIYLRAYNFIYVYVQVIYTNIQIQTVIRMSVFVLFLLLEYIIYQNLPFSPRKFQIHCIFVLIPYLYSGTINIKTGLGKDEPTKIANTAKCGPQMLPSCFVHVCFNGIQTSVIYSTTMIHFTSASPLLFLLWLLLLLLLLLLLSFHYHFFFECYRALLP